MNRTSAFLCLLLMSACTKPEHGSFPDPQEQANRKAREFCDKLAGELGRAAFVEVVEHSNVTDFPDEAFPAEPFPNPPSRSPELVPKIEYGRIRLSAVQKQALVKRVRLLKDDLPDVDYLCGFVPHHTIEIHGSSGAKSELEICFLCAGIQWSASVPHVSRKEWVEEFRVFFADLGLKPDADWKARVLESGKVPSP